MLGKISRLPLAIREQLDQRLRDAQSTAVLLEWLNSLPEVQAALTQYFDGEPITQQNLSKWKLNGFRKWRLRQTALEFAADLAPDHSPTAQALTSALSEKLAQWTAIRYAAAAEALVAVDEDPQTELRHLREFCADVATLRRGDLSAGRLALEQQRLALEKARSDEEKQQEFWEWTKRPDIHAKLYPNRDPEKVRRDVERILNRRLLGIRAPDDLDETADPAALI